MARQITLAFISMFFASVAQADWAQNWENLNPAVQNCTRIVQKRWPQLAWDSRRDVSVSRHNRPLTNRQTQVVRTLVSFQVDNEQRPPRTYRIQCGLDIKQRVTAISRRTEKPPKKRQ